MEANRHNHITATYHLLNKKSQRNQYMRDTYGNQKKNDIDIKREKIRQNFYEKNESVEGFFISAILLF